MTKSGTFTSKICRSAGCVILLTSISVSTLPSRVFLQIESQEKSAGNRLQRFQNQDVPVLFQPAPRDAGPHAKFLARGNRYRLLIGARGAILAVSRYITGTKASADFPTTPGAVQSTNAGGTDAFVAKLDPTGELHRSTKFGSKERKRF